MGIELTKALFARHAHDLTASELVVLGYMCLTALDRENDRGVPARLYFAGREPLGIALGHDTFTDAARQKVKRAVQGLRRRGLITPLIDHARSGTRQVYRINVGPNAGGQEVTPSGVRRMTPSKGTPHDPLRGTPGDPPRTYTGIMEDSPQDISLPSVTELQTARASRGRRTTGRKLGGSA